MPIEFVFLATYHAMLIMPLRCHLPVRFLISINRCTTKTGNLTEGAAAVEHSLSTFQYLDLIPVSNLQRHHVARFVVELTVAQDHGSGCQ